MTEAVTQRWSEKKNSEEFRKTHRKTPVPVSLFLWSCRLRPATLLKKRLRHRCFSVNFEKCLRTPLLYRTPLVVAYGLRLYISIFRSMLHFYIYLLETSNQKPLNFSCFYGVYWPLAWDGLNTEQFSLNFKLLNKTFVMKKSTLLCIYFFDILLFINTLFYKQLVHKQLAFRTKFVKQFLGLNHLQ